MCLSIRRFINCSVSVGLLLIVHTGNADTEDTSIRFIVDKIYVTVRQSADKTSPVVERGLTSGSVVSVVQEDADNGYNLIETSRGNQGWVHSRYLQRDPTADMKVEGLERKIEELTAATDMDLRRELEESRLLSQKLSGENINIERKMKEITLASKNLTKITGNNRTLIEDNQALQNRVDSLEATLEQKASDQSTRFFIYGGLLVLATLILNSLLASIRRRRSYNTDW
jgi:SH3 domain protein